MMRSLANRLAALEQRRPAKQRRVAIIGEHDPEPTDADFVIRLVPAPLADTSSTISKG